MTPGARVAAAIDVLDVWLDGVAAEKALTSWARGSRYAGSKDRAAIRDHVYDVLRQLESCTSAGGACTGRGLMIGLCRITDLPLDALFSGDGYAADRLSEGEATAPDLSDDPWRDIPTWLQPALRDALGGKANEIIATLSTRAPLYLRKNSRVRADVELENSLASDGIKIRNTLHVNAVEVIEGTRRVKLSQAYHAGQIEIQDLSVQLACAAITWPDSGTILDYCAGGGGKALAIAAVTDADIYVHDAIPTRMADIPARAERAGAILHAFDPDMRHDLVLCDVPCSGSGTWRRDPEAKWHLTPKKLADLQETQASILDEAAQVVRPGGRLVYMTCSFLNAENADQIAAFQDRNSGWQLTKSARFTPLEASDGFFVAELTWVA